MEALSQQAMRIVKLFAEKTNNRMNSEAAKVVASVGPEQEYFLVDREKYLKRPDLILRDAHCSELPHPKDRRWRITISEPSESAWAHT